MGSRDEQIEAFRLEHESDEHWELRREFLEEHFDKFHTSKLLCLSHTYVNIEVLGCRYPNETMKIIADLAAGLGSAHKKRKEKNAQRITMDASNAAEQRIKHRTGGELRNNPQPKVTYGPSVVGGPSVNYGPPVTGNRNYGYRT
ncbi:partner of xrn-2 protein 1 [Neocloeon triangulifer]|uniref:partner of xrn-2 protein 1 n=1 Tax=Neocloeon triangulifer TaxID=2078957 RepID=UPI00286F9F97|nr:partner of xrn-2 protein 1 [Neocloeon triangulifer]